MIRTMGIRRPRTAPHGDGVALLYSGRFTADAWSGIPAHLFDALQALGWNPVACGVETPRADAMLVARLSAVALARDFARHRQVRPRLARKVALLDARLAPGMQARAADQLRGSSLRGAIALGSGFVPPSGLRFVTYEDMTIRQAARPSSASADWSLLSAKRLEQRVAIQAHCYEQAVACCVTSSWGAESIVNDYGVDPAKVHVVGIGSRFEPRAVVRDWSVPRFLFVGMNWERKNGDAIVRAFREVRQRYPAAELHLVGRHPELAEPGIVCHGVLALGDRDAVVRLAALYDQATCYAMPSVHEPSAMAYLEAAASGIPSIGTTVGGSAELIGDGGLVVDPHDDRAIVGAMLELCEPERARELGAIAQQGAEGSSWTSVARQLVAALQLTDCGLRKPPSLADDVDLEIGPLVAFGRMAS